MSELQENNNNDFEKISSLSEEDLNKIFKEMTPEEIEDLLDKINEVGNE